MITEERLRAAAAKSSEIYVRYLEQNFDVEQQHRFSLGFEKKIKKLTRKANHPVFYRSLQRIASVFLAMVVGGTIWLFFDIEAQAMFFGWVREFYETYIVYRFEPDMKGSISAEAYYPIWLPEGYQEVSSNCSGNTIDIRYIDAEGQGLIFSYSNCYDNVDWFVDKSMSTLKQVYVNGLSADLFLADNPETANTITWTTPDGTAFFISAFLSESNLIRVAESVQLIIK